MILQWTDHLIIAPVLLPLAASALLLLIDERRRAIKNGVALGAVLVNLAATIALLAGVVDRGWDTGVATRAYLVGDWPAPYGIVLVIDWLSALMLVVTAILGLAALIYASGKWERAGPRFHSLFLLQLVGLNGAFLTGDLFNLFVFFEVLLAASYGLLLHGSGTGRVRAGLHYVTINVLASLFFLIGASMIYGVTGTLNMADLATRIPMTSGNDLALLQAGMGVLGVAFLIKAGMWPLGLWLPRTYAAATPPAAAIFAMLSKVGIYAILRVYLLLFGAEVGWTASFGEEFLLYGGMATIAFATLGILAVRTLDGVAGYSILISSGSLLAVIGAGQGAVLEGALLYLVSSTLGIGAFYLLIELVERTEGPDEPADVTEQVFDDEYTGAVGPGEEEEIAVFIPPVVAILGGGFLFCAVLLAGLPPLSGFVAKFAMIHGLLNLEAGISVSAWLLTALLLLSGLATLIATTRAGIDLIWTPEKSRLVLRVREAAPVAMLLAACLALMILAGPVMRYMERTEASLNDRNGYIRAVLDSPTVKNRDREQ